MERIWTTHYDQGVRWDLELKEKNVVQFLDASASRWGSRPAVTLKGNTLTYAQLKEQVDRFATGLAKLGVQKDTRVALWMPNLPQYVIAYFAILRLGAQVVPTNPLYVEREIEHQFNDAGVTVVVTLDFLWRNRLRQMMGKTGVEHVVVASIPDYLPFPLSWLAPFKLKKTGQYVKVPREKRVHFFKDLIAHPPPTPPAASFPMDHIAVLQYTGGTTGVAKGAVLTHRNISANAQQCRALFAIAEEGSEVLLACLPYFHSFGMTASMLLPVLMGCHIVLAPNPRDISDLVKSIIRYRVTVFLAVPAIFGAINNFPGIERLDISSIKACISGSAPLPVETLERFEKLTGGKIAEGFGMTEASPVTHCNPINGLRKVGSIGLPLPRTDIKVVDLETGERELEFGQAGELCLRGPQVMAGYLGRPEETASTLRDGWLYSGDLARVDEDGYTFIVGRKKEMIVAGGYNVYPDEVDGVLYAHPAIMEAATIGVPDPKRGETVKSFVVLHPDAKATAEEIRAFCKKELAAYKVPKLIEIVPELPKSSMMKILRRDLRERELKKLEDSSRDRG
jgi:long-chain acyl-CoA synthetase